MNAEKIPASHQSHPYGFALAVTFSHNDRLRMHTIRDCIPWAGRDVHRIQ